MYLAPLASAHNPAPDALRRAVHASLIRHACVDPAATEPALRFLTRFLSHALRGVPPASPSAPAEAAFCASVATDALDVVDCLSDDWEGPGGSGEAGEVLAVDFANWHGRGAGGMHTVEAADVLAT